ncbi:MAG: hypothetical protein ACYTDT_01715 [Planctomycetota bacterium]|jgi:hypothetical protein
MRSSVSILVVLYLAIAPGMDVSQLLHSVSLCKYFEAQVKVTSCDQHMHHQHHQHHHQHKHENKTPEDLPDEHHHDENIVVEADVIPAITTFSFASPTVNFGHEFTPLLNQQIAEPSPLCNPRAPPWVLQFLTVKQNV